MTQSPIPSTDPTRRQAWIQFAAACLGSPFLGILSEVATDATGKETKEEAREAIGKIVAGVAATLADKLLEELDKRFALPVYPVSSFGYQLPPIGTTPEEELRQMQTENKIREAANAKLRAEMVEAGFEDRLIVNNLDVGKFNDDDEDIDESQFEDDVDDFDDDDDDDDDDEEEPEDDTEDDDDEDDIDDDDDDEEDDEEDFEDDDE